MRSKQFWIDLLERAARTFAQVLVAAIPVGMILWEIPWTDALGVAATAAVISALTSIGASSKGDPTSASLVDAPGRHRAEP